MKRDNDDVRILVGEGLRDLPAPEPRLGAILIERLGEIAAVVGMVEERAEILLVVEEDPDDPFLLQHPREHAEVFDRDGPIAKKIRGPVHVHEGEIVRQPGEGEPVQRSEIAGNLRVAAGGSIHQRGTGGAGERHSVEREAFNVGEMVAHVFGSAAKIALLRID